MAHKSEADIIQHTHNTARYFVSTLEGEQKLRPRGTSLRASCIEIRRHADVEGSKRDTVSDDTPQH